MAIKMRHSKNPDAVCCNCHDTVDECIEMFDICIGNTILTICDLCNNDILKKTLSANVGVNMKVKSQHELAIIRRRKEEWRS